MTVKVGVASNHLIHPIPRFDVNFVDYIQRDYIDGLRQADALPLVLPLGDPKDAKAYIEQVDALVLSGGQGVTPVLYGDEPIKEVAETDIYRDQFEIALVKAAVKAHKPVLGICRGEQIINVALGGTLFQDIYKQMGAVGKHNQFPTSWEIPTQHVTTTDGSWLNQILGERFLVNTFHHQAIHQLGENLKSVAESDDHVVEAIESQDGNIIGVQFHPEMMFKTHPEFAKVFDYFVDRVRAGS
ncbi:MAG: gamma-glutamyl-gamma-aminobutyrate hydrolase family protein [Lentilactobacillus diolivorans]|uniref:gamma-glutamyl-gamma-aminobutyrate hydrolase family protein n=1 Tax=Lentilactobacillus diolivorans TaxID=179838 RepID=UPI000FEDED66|nr:gamma-glutamyl-gamma-aminobutyrate hydrolase family protein [Lentilactobacillus diolivorans]MCH4163301.1 gamma-glutamyl-gamma-aminobutyrate hydrolase family protein [Lentilactobacillus diolivorans]MDH5105071.1 gamma-glutamyl-gamma-aminobutyrate hydrolase family protein [Lentilactobacillus diolivorans]RRG02809.1 MAG: gamma-glutamyl-gamma-aminobutyrate hydrolase family protein [Lactobacillus sp.]